MAYICRMLDRRFTVSLFQKFCNLTQLRAAHFSNFASLSRLLVPFTLIQPGIFQTLWCTAGQISSVNAVATTLRCSVNYTHPHPCSLLFFKPPLFSRSVLHLQKSTLCAKQFSMQRFTPNRTFSFLMTCVFAVSRALSHS